MISLKNIFLKVSFCSINWYWSYFSQEPWHELVRADCVHLLSLTSAQLYGYVCRRTPSGRRYLSLLLFTGLLGLRSFSFDMEIVYQRVHMWPTLKYIFSSVILNTRESWTVIILFTMLSRLNALFYAAVVTYYAKCVNITLHFFFSFHVMFPRIENKYITSEFQNNCKYIFTLWTLLITIFV